MNTTNLIDWRWVAGQEIEIAQIRELFLEYQAELGIDLCFQSFQEELDSLPGKYVPPDGALLLGHCSSAPMACGALRRLDADTCELKRVYIRPSFRGQGLGEPICQMLMDEGRKLGYTKVRLDTLRRLIPAGKIYRKLGFEEIEPYNFDPGHDIVYFERRL